MKIEVVQVTVKIKDGSFFPSLYSYLLSFGEEIFNIDKFHIVVSTKGIITIKVDEYSILLSEKGALVHLRSQGAISEIEDLLRELMELVEKRIFEKEFEV